MECDRQYNICGDNIGTCPSSWWLWDVEEEDFGKLDTSKTIAGLCTKYCDCPPGYEYIGQIKKEGDDKKQTGCRKSYDFPTREERRNYSLACIDPTASRTICGCTCTTGCKDFFEKNCIYSPNTEDWHYYNCDAILDGIDSEMLITKREFNELVDRTVRRAEIGEVNKPDVNGRKWLSKICGKYPGACDKFLKEYCSPLKRDELIGENVRTCGCFLQDREYDKFSGMLEVPTCDPLCVASDIKQGECTGDICYSRQCGQGVCILDDVAINLADSKGGITIDQMCIGNNNRCQMVNIDIDAARSTIGKIKFDQKCGSAEDIDYNCSNGTCVATTTDGEYEDYDDCEGECGEEPSDKKWIWIGIAASAILITALIVLVIKRKR